MAQLRGQACLPRTTRPRHHSDSNVATTSSLRRYGSIRSRRCPHAKLTDLIALLIRHHTMSRSHELQGREILWQLGISRGQDLFDVSPGRNLPIRVTAAQPPNVHADVPFPVVDILST